MTEQERIELARLAEAKHKAEQNLYWFGFTNVANLDTAGLTKVAQRRAELEAEQVIANATYRAFMTALESRTETTAAKVYQHHN